MPPPIVQSGWQLLQPALTSPVTVLQVEASAEVRTLHVWTDPDWYVSAPLTPGRTVAFRCTMLTELSGETAGGLVRTRVLQPRGESLLVPAGAALRVTVSMAAYGGATWEWPTSKVYATISPGIPQQREVWGGSWGGDALSTTVIINANEYGGNVAGDPFTTGARFATSVTVTLTGTATIDYGGSSWAFAPGVYRFSPDLKMRFTFGSNTILSAVWSVFE